MTGSSFDVGQLPDERVCQWTCAKHKHGLENTICQWTPVEAAIARGYDYIVVGGGTAGLVVAARLTEDPAVSLLVLEAGASNLEDVNILRLASYGTHFGHPSYDWGFETIPQEHCEGQVYPWPRGKGLGGSSAINYNMWTKPPAADLDDIERLGNPGWNWKNINKYITRAEKFTEPLDAHVDKHNIRFQVASSGKEGTLCTAFPGHMVECESEIQQTFINAGLQHAKNPLGGDPSGVFYAPNTIDTETHTRSYAATAYLKPHMNRPNLHILVSAHVTRVLTKAGVDGVEATGVEFIHNGETSSVFATREVILAAGALKTPQLLELSGIGSRTILDAAGVPLKIDLPAVGENVQEHWVTNVSWELKEDVLFDTFDVLRDLETAVQHIELHKNGKGLFTSGLTGVAFVPLEAISSRASELQHAITQRIQERAGSLPPGLKQQYDISLERLARRAPSCEILSAPAHGSRPNPPEPKKKYWTISPGCNNSFSRGSIHITSDDPTMNPEFNPRYFSEDIDFQIFLDLVKWVRKLADVEPFKSMIVREVNPGLEVTTDGDIGSWARKYMTTTYHTCGSASMLPKDKGGVVTPQLIVYGTSNLRVVDLSILPLHIASHPVAVVYGMAELAADIIKGKFA